MNAAHDLSSAARREAATISTSRRRWSFTAAIVLALCAAAAGAADGPGPARGTTSAEGEEPATLRILNRDVVVLRARVGGLTPQQRVQRTQQRLRELPAAAIDAPLSALPSTFGSLEGVTIVVGERPLVSLVPADVDPESKQNLDALVRQTLGRLEQVRVVWHELHDGERLLRGAIRAAVASLLLGVLVWVTYRVSRVAVVWMEKKRDILAARFPYVDWREFLARLAVASMVLVQWLVLAALVYAWLYAVLGGFDVTSPLAERLHEWLIDKLAWLGDGLLDSLPGLATVLIVLVISRAIADVVRYFFDAVQKGRIRLGMFHPETAAATRRICTLVVWALGISIAYPYLPGSNTEAFKGISVLLGLVLTLGSAGLITQVMSGLVIVYSRSLVKGDFVDINGVQGVVTEMGALAIKVVNVQNEEVTIPNSVVVTSPIRNYSKLDTTLGTLVTTKVTIGYDAPWRQVHALLIGAALKTTGVRESPNPYVYQRSLSDFYVEYELFASIDEPWRRVPVLSELHANILDEFNQHGVQIMSPHYLGQPSKSVVVPEDRWFAEPARKP
jgi:small-conductance mechanosensitive channel